MLFFPRSIKEFKRCDVHVEIVQRRLSRLRHIDDYEVITVINRRVTPGVYVTGNNDPDYIKFIKMIELLAPILNGASETSNIDLNRGEKNG